MFFLSLLKPKSSVQKKKYLVVMLDFMLLHHVTINVNNFSIFQLILGLRGVLIVQCNSVIPQPASFSLAACGVHFSTQETTETSCN